MRLTIHKIKKVNFIFNYIKYLLLYFIIGLVVSAVYDNFIHQIPFYEYRLADDLGRIIVTSIMITTTLFIAKKSNGDDL